MNITLGILDITLHVPEEDHPFWYEVHLLSELPPFDQDHYIIIEGTTTKPHDPVFNQSHPLFYNLTLPDLTPEVEGDEHEEHGGHPHINDEDDVSHFFHYFSTKLVNKSGEGI